MMPAEQKLRSNHQALINTALAGLAVLMVFFALFVISSPFEYGGQRTQPVLLVVGLLIAATVFALVGLGFALEVATNQSKCLLMIILGLAVSIRLVALFTTPILEIDYYRYIWDGKVVCEGVSPYRFSPAAVLESGVSPDDRLNRLGVLSTRSQSNHVILNRVHYEDFTSVYPPVSQFVFAVTMWLTPETASVDAHVIAIKAVMILFDLATMLLLVWLLRTACLHRAWLIPYAWNPLVIKEIANSGHLDSIATFFVVLTVYLVVRQRHFPAAGFRKLLLLFAGVALGLGVGAKLYPIVLFPLLLVAVISGNAHDPDARRSGVGKKLFAGAVFTVAFLLTSFFVLLPLLERHSSPVVTPAIGAAHLPADLSAIETTKPTLINRSDASKIKDGFNGFFSSWRMNDPVFSTLYFNLKYDANDSMTPWYVVVPNHWRNQLDQQYRIFGRDGKNAAYLVTRILTLSFFCLYYLWYLVIQYRKDDEGGKWVVDLARGIVFILAVFLFLQPTVNPWYFVWIAPLTCMTNSRSWLLASGFLTLYYTRFWFKSLTETFTIGDQSFDGVRLFDHCFVFVEFGLIIAVLICFSNWKTDRQAPDTTIVD